MDKMNHKVEEDIVSAKVLKEKLNLKTQNMIGKSDLLMSKADDKANRMIVKAKGRAQKVISKV